MHNVSQWPNLRHLSEPLEGTVGLLEAMSFMKTAEVSRPWTVGAVMLKPREAKVCGHVELPADWY